MKLKFLEGSNFSSQIKTAPYCKSKELNLHLSYLAPLKNKPQVKAMGNLTIKDKETDLKIFHLLDVES
ncbi:MAG: hypothetical protein COT84_03350 [Chlamydiae bacterium CG10_big_fil_rev_8_21_14_0_10_35_9]|nr:MAG: hypothetical protein COT84_03350 [Chlamydiae bacterium CG10_big_fil_rev_8_21_14_0_10_35_9]